MEVGGRGAWAEEEVGWGEGKSPSPGIRWDPPGLCLVLLRPRTAPGLRGPWLGRSLVNGQMNESERGRGGAEPAGWGEGRGGHWRETREEGAGRLGRACRFRIRPGGGGEGPSGRPPRQPALDLVPLALGLQVSTPGEPWGSSVLQGLVLL